MQRFELPELISSVVKRIKTQSVLAPLLALVAICGVIALGVLWKLDGPLSNWGFGSIVAICVLYTMVWYAIWSLHDPDRLQTEDYHLAQQHMALIGDERNPNSPELLEGRSVSKTAHFAEYQN